MTTKKNNTKTPDFSDAPLGVRVLATAPTDLVCDVDGKPVIYTIVRHVSASGMTRIIDAFVISIPSGGRPLSLCGAAKNGSFPLINARFDYNREGFVVKGVGMNMAWWLASGLASACGLGDNFSHVSM